MLGFISLIIVYSSMLPSVLGLAGTPPIEMNLLMILGTALFMLDSYLRKQYVYSATSVIGLGLNFVILYRILF